jgi:hypothetical protein
MRAASCVPVCKSLVKRAASCSPHNDFVWYPAAGCSPHNDFVLHPAAGCSPHNDFVWYPAASCSPHNDFVSHPAASCLFKTFSFADSSWLVSEHPVHRHCSTDWLTGTTLLDVTLSRAAGSCRRRGRSPARPIRRHVFEGGGAPSEPRAPALTEADGRTTCRCSRLPPRVRAWLRRARRQRCGSSGRLDGDTARAILGAPSGLVPKPPYTLGRRTPAQ